MEMDVKHLMVEKEVLLFRDIQHGALSQVQKEEGNGRPRSREEVAVHGGATPRGSRTEVGGQETEATKQRCRPRPSKGRPGWDLSVCFCSSSTSQKIIAAAEDPARPVRPRQLGEGRSVVKATTYRRVLWQGLVRSCTSAALNHVLRSQARRHTAPLFSTPACKYPLPT